MNTATKPSPAPKSTMPNQGVPSADEPILFSIIKENSTVRAILIGAAIFVVFGGLWQMFGPKIGSTLNDEGWREFHLAIDQNGLESLRGENLAATLDGLSGQTEVYPFVVITAAADALANGDEDAMRIVKPELEKVVAAGTLSSFRVSEEGQSQAEVETLLAKLNAELENPNAGLDFRTAEPTGRQFKVTLRLGETKTYEMLFGLYDDIAPVTTAHFVEAMKNGLTERTGKYAGVYNLRFDGLVEEHEHVEGEEHDHPEPLPLEAQRGYFHQAGVLATVSSVGGAGGEQDPAQFALYLEDATFFDGRSTVFAKLINDPDNCLDALQALKPSANDATLPDQAVTIVSAKLMP